MTDVCEAECEYKLKVAQIDAAEPHRRRIISWVYAKCDLEGKIWNQMDREARMAVCDRLAMNDRLYAGTVGKDWEDMTDRRRRAIQGRIDTREAREKLDRIYGMTSTGWIWSNPAAMEARGEGRA